MYTQEHLDAIDEVIAGGESSVEINGRKITNYPLTDLMKIRRLIIRDLRRQSGKKKSPLSGVRLQINRGV